MVIYKLVRRVLAECFSRRRRHALPMAGATNAIGNYGGGGFYGGSSSMMQQSNPYYGSGYPSSASMMYGGGNAYGNGYGYPHNNGYF